MNTNTISTSEWFAIQRNCEDRLSESYLWISTVALARRVELSEDALKELFDLLVDEMTALGYDTCEVSAGSTKVDLTKDISNAFYIGVGAHSAELWMSYIDELECEEA